MEIKLLSAVLFFFAPIASFTQNAVDILKKSSQKCQSIQNGYLEMESYKMFMSDKDTFKTAYTGYFKKLKDNSLSTAAFRYKHYYMGEYLGDVIFTGNEFVRTSPHDSTATIMSKELWIDKIRENAQVLTSGSPLTGKESDPLPLDDDYTDNEHTFKFIGEEVVNNNSCYRIQMNVAPKNGNTGMKIFRTEYNYWIKKEDLVPIQYTIEYDLVMNNDTMYQYERTIITKYEINNVKEEGIFAMRAIPTYYKLIDFVPVKRAEPLPKDTMAPNFKLLSLTGKEISLAGLKGRLVLLDFFFKSCYSCMKALPALQELHEKYKGKGLHIIGIDPVDKEADDLTAFLAKRGVTYPVLLGQGVATDYRVSSCPTTYLVDKNGKIIYIEVGYGNDSKSKLEEIILKNL